MRGLPPRARLRDQGGCLLGILAQNLHPAHPSGYCRSHSRPQYRLRAQGWAPAGATIPHQAPQYCLWAEGLAPAGAAGRPRGFVLSAAPALHFRSCCSTSAILAHFWFQSNMRSLSLTPYIHPSTGTVTHMNASSRYTVILTSSKCKHRYMQACASCISISDCGMEV